MSSPQYGLSHHARSVPLISISIIIIGLAVIAWSSTSVEGSEEWPVAMDGPSNTCIQESAGRLDEIRTRYIIESNESIGIPVMGDTDHDGSMDIICIYDEQIASFSGLDGTIQWRGDWISSFMYPIALAHGMDRAYIAAFTVYSDFVVINGTDGITVIADSRFNHQSAFFNSITAFDSDEDGYEEFYCRLAREVFAFDTRTMVFKWNVTLPYSPNSALCVGRIEDGGEALVFVGDESDSLSYDDHPYADRILMFDCQDGSLYDSFQISDFTESKIALIDVDMDGYKDIAFFELIDNFRIVSGRTFKDLWSVTVTPILSIYFNVFFFIETGEDTPFLFILTYKEIRWYNAGTGDLMGTFDVDAKWGLGCNLDGNLISDLIVISKYELFVIFDLETKQKMFDLTDMPATSRPDKINNLMLADIDGDHLLEAVLSIGGNDYSGIVVLDSDHRPGVTVGIDHNIPSDGVVYPVVDVMRLNISINYSVDRDAVLFVSVAFAWGDDGIELKLILSEPTRASWNGDLMGSLLVHGWEETRSGTGDIWQLDLQITIGFGWTFPHTDPCDIEVSVMDWGGMRTDVHYDDLFRLESRLKIHDGNVRIQGQRTVPVLECETIIVGLDSSVRLEDLEISFHGNRSRRPPEDVIIYGLVGDGLRTDGELNANGTYRIDLEYPHLSDETMLVIVADIPSTEDQILTEIPLIVDGDAPIFDLQFPPEDVWLTTSVQEAGIGIYDPGFGPDPDTISYQVLSVDGDIVVGWTLASIMMEHNDHLYAITTLELLEGRYKIKWRAMDLGGNGFSISDDRSLNVDLHGVVFSRITPEGWFNEPTIQFEVKISDQGGSGVDVDSISYSFSSDGMAGLTTWIPIAAGTAGPSVNVDVALDLEEMIDNMIVVRTSDLAGNEAISEIFRLPMDMTPCMFGSFLPNATVASYGGPVECSIIITDNLSGLNVSSIGYRYRTANGDWSDLEPIETFETEDDGWSLTVNRTWLEVHENYIQFSVMDVAGNGPTLSNEYQVRLNVPPIPHIGSPLNKSRFKEDVPILVDGNGTRDEDPLDHLVFTWVSSVDGVIGTGKSSTVGNLSIGTHRITLWVDDGAGHNVSTSIMITMVDETSVSAFDVDPWILILAAGVLTVTALAYFRYFRTRDEVQR